MCTCVYVEHGILANLKFLYQHQYTSNTPTSKPTHAMNSSIDNAYNTKIFNSSNNFKIRCGITVINNAVVTTTNCIHKLSK